MIERTPDEALENKPGPGEVIATITNVISAEHQEEYNIVVELNNDAEGRDSIGFNSIGFIGVHERSAINCGISLKPGTEVILARNERCFTLSPLKGRRYYLMLYTDRGR